MIIQVQVYIGDELPISTMKDCSVVTATYELGEGMHGTIGIVGPKRMDYENVVNSLKTLKVELDEVFKKIKTTKTVSCQTGKAVEETCQKQQKQLVCRTKQRKKFRRLKEPVTEPVEESPRQPQERIRKEKRSGSRRRKRIKRKDIFLWQKKKDNKLEQQIEDLTDR